MSKKTKVNPNMNKADHIRAEIANLESIGEKPKAAVVVANLQAKGVEVGLPHVYQIFGSLKKKNRQSTVATRKVSKKQQTKRFKITIDDLVAAKRFVEKVGGLDVAKNTIETYNLLITSN